ncbi:hypothetical protein PanWU01x14_336810 [Parasponia andersonii]|uniref:Uncharacterized protein n=1 Tax=Parasponia andersonii TaxID=3476 RepID=A0A2P5AFS9_PARAD|nr:hypothetical protein PanWU01x14_336810 [Parasponia andersonii]
MGLLDGGEEIFVYNNIEINPVRDEIVGPDGRIIVSDLVLDIQNLKEVDDIFVIRFILLIISTILWLTSAFWSGTNIRQLVHYSRRSGGYENVKLHKVYDILHSVRYASEQAQPRISPTSTQASILKPDGMQCCSCEYKSKLTKVKADAIDEEDNSREEDEDTKEEYDDLGDEDKENISAGSTNVYVEKDLEEGQLLSRNIDFSEYVNNSGDKQEYLNLSMTTSQYARKQEWKEKYLGDLSVFQQFFPVDEQLCLTLRIICQPPNKIKDLITAEVEKFIYACRNPKNDNLDMDCKQSTSSSILIRNLLESPKD